MVIDVSFFYFFFFFVLGDDVLSLCLAGSNLCYTIKVPITVSQFMFVGTLGLRSRVVDFVRTSNGPILGVFTPPSPS